MLSLLLCSLLASLPVPGNASAPSKRPAPDPIEDAQANEASEALTEARTLLSDGKVDEAEARAYVALAIDPYLTDGYGLMADIAKIRDDHAGRLRWNKWLYWAHKYSGREGEAKAVARELEALQSGWNRDEAILGEWRRSVEKAVRSATSSKQFLVAGHLMGKLLDLDPANPDVRRQFDKLYEKAGETVTGGAFTAARVRRRSAKWIERQNTRHAPWDNAFERKTAHYNLITNISYEFFETISVVMEDMFRFYQLVYDYRKKAPVVTLAIHRKRSDFDRYCIDTLGGGGLSLGVGGWFWDRKMTVAAYDRTGTGADLSDLYRVLFHEASHQFMYLLCEKKTKQDPPTWLNEGTASYFEGCELKADGSIVKNKPALGRVLEWEWIEASERRHSLKELITCAHRRYDGSFYSYGWSFVYFLNNYEDPDGNLVYRDAYLQYLDSYTKKGPRDPSEQQAEAFARAERMFVDEIGDSEVPNWKSFEDRWRRYTQGIVQASKAGPELADDLQDRARGYLGREDFERALITAEQADDKRPDDAETYRLLADAMAGLGREEDGLFWMLRRWELAWMTGDLDAVRDAEAWLKKNGGKDILEHYCGATQTTLEALGEAMGAAEDGGHPTLAMLFASHGMQAFGLMHEGLLTRIAELRESSEQDLRLWERAFTKGEEANRMRGGVEVVRHDPDGVLVNTPENEDDAFTLQMETCDVRTLSWLAPPYDVRGGVQVDGKQGAYLLLGVGRNGRPRAALHIDVDPEDMWAEMEVVEIAIDEDSPGRTVNKHETVGERMDLERTGRVPFQVSVLRDGGEVLLGNESAKQGFAGEWGADRMVGRLSVAAGEDTVALFSEVEVRREQPFWPVRPAEDEDR